VQKALIYKGFSQTQSFVLVINTTVSTWLEPLGLMSWADYLNLTFKGTCQWVFSFFSENRRSRKQINLYIMAIPFNLISCTYTAVNADPLFPA
jgi:hypothetical protein